MVKPLFPLLVALTVGLLPAPVAGQATNPAYLSDFPSVARVKQAMQTGDPRESALRQMGAFWQLQEIIKALSGHREFRGYLPDEARLLQDYGTAEYTIGQAIDAAFPGRYRDGNKVSENRPYAFSRDDSRFGVEGIPVLKTLLTPAIQDQFRRTMSGELARRNAPDQPDTVDRNRTRAAQARALSDTAAVRRAFQEAAASAESAAAQSPRGRQERANRRCMEAGRSETQCMMEGFGSSLSSLAEGMLPGLKSAPVFGLRMTGDYPGPGGVRLTFDFDNVTLRCGDLESQQVPYSTAVRNGQVIITIPTAPRSFALVFRPDERLAGPGPVDITGQVQVGIQEGVRTWSDGRTEPISRPVYEPRTRHCNLGVLASTGHQGSAQGGPAALFTLLLGNPDQNAEMPVPPGLRMTGEYGTQTGFDVEFHPEGAVVGCREAAVLRPYTVVPQGGQVLVKIQHGQAPLVLALGADGRLTGSGTVRVDGRKVVGTDPGGAIAYAPRSESCAISPIGPGSGTATAAGGGEPPAAAPAGTPRTVTPGSGAFVQLESGLPAPAGGSNPLAGHGFMLLDVPLDNVFKEAGVTPPAGVSAPKGIGQLCSSGDPGCQKVMGAINAHTIAVLKPDARGTAQSTELPAGRQYYLSGSVNYGGKILFWNLPVDARHGWNKVTLDQKNTAPDR